MFFGTLKLNRALQFVFGSLTILFILLALAHGLGNKNIDKIAGYEGIICGASAIYTGMAVLLNEVYDKTVLPIGPMA
jgi:succinate-acetate transporter protein